MSTFAVAAMAAVGLGLWRVALLRRRLELVARAEHELRGAVTALHLAHDRGAGAVEVQFDRMRAALADLHRARCGGRAPVTAEPVAFEPFVAAALEPWGAAGPREGGLTVVCADRGRLAQALGNLAANAHEHGSGDLDVSAKPTPGGVRLDLSNRAPGGGRQPQAGRGRGLGIARSAAAALGGSLEARAEAGRFVASLELPVDRGAPPPAA